MSFAGKSQAAGGASPTIMPPHEAAIRPETTATAVVQERLEGGVAEGSVPRFTRQPVFHPYPATLSTTPQPIPLPSIPSKSKALPNRSPETSESEEDSIETSDMDSSASYSESTDESESSEQILRFTKKARKPESKSRDWLQIAGIVILVAGAVLVGFVALCIAGIFPIDFLGKIGCACTVVGGCIVMAIGGGIIYYRWQVPKSDKP